VFAGTELDRNTAISDRWDSAVYVLAQLEFGMFSQPTSEVAAPLNPETV
jgi:hypothetical protein